MQQKVIENLEGELKESSDALKALLATLSR